MQTITATELARNTRQILDRVASTGETISVERNRTPIAQIVPPEKSMTAAQALAGLRPMLSKRQGDAWQKESQGSFDESLRDPWA